jgi:radical SAM protein with 4Fe4S-binding SPASM domain
MKNVVLFLTNECNLNCSYCYQFRSTGSMDFETARKAIDFLAMEGEEICRIGFYGGEPLIEFQLMKEVIEYSSLKLGQKGIESEYRVTTNGMLLDNEMFDYLAKWHVKVSLSIDGTREIHEQGKGKGTFSKIETLLSLARRHPQCSVGTVTVVSPGNIGHLFESVEFLHGNGIRDFVIGSDIHQEWSEEALQLFREQFSKLRNLVEDHYSRTGEILVKGFDFGESREVPYQCTPGKRTLAVTPGGEVYGCTMLVPSWRKAKEQGFLSNFSDLQLGCVDDFLDPDFRKETDKKISGSKLFNQYYRYTRKKRCKDCEHLYNCYICPGIAMSYSKDPFLIPESVCERSKIRMSLPLRNERSAGSLRSE